MYASYVSPMEGPRPLESAGAMPYAEGEGGRRPRRSHLRAKEDAMPLRKTLWIALAMVCLAAPRAASQTGGTVSYKLDGRAFSFTDSRLEHYQADGYVSLVAERVEMVVDPSGPEDEKREITVGMSIQLAKEESQLVGDHRSSTPDEMPTHFSWYEIVPTEDKKGKTIKEFLAGLDEGDETMMFIRLKIETFGPVGGLVTGTFEGKLYDEDGKLHEITGGVFRVPRVEAK